MEGLSFDALVANADYVRFGLLSAVLLIPRAQFVRLIVALYAGLELALAIINGPDQTTIIWMSVLLGLALLLIVGTILSNRRVRLAGHEQVLASRLLKGVGRARARHFLDQGYWLNGNPGEVLLREGEPVDQFCFLSEGEGRVMMGGRQIGLCRGGDIVGGLGFFSGETAAASVVLTTPARFWCAPAERLRPYFDVHSDLRRKIERSIATGPAAAERDDAAPLQAGEPVPAV